MIKYEIEYSFVANGKIIIEAKNRKDINRALCQTDAELLLNGIKKGEKYQPFWGISSLKVETIKARRG